MIAEAQFNRATLDCMTALRRRLKQSLGVTIHLSEPDAAEHMIDLSRDCTQDDIRDLGKRLASMLEPIAPEPEEAFGLQSAIAARQRQMSQPRATRPSEPAPASMGTGSVRIYRGQVIRS